MVRRALRASSASTGACSKPTKPSTATTARTPKVPNPAEVRAAGERVAKLRCPPAGCASPATVSTRMTMISAQSRTPRIRPVMSTRSRPSTVITAQAPSAQAHHAACTCRWAAASLAAFGPNAPYRPTCRNEYASSATSAAATPMTRPMPRETKA